MYYSSFFLRLCPNVSLISQQRVQPSKSLSIFILQIIQVSLSCYFQIYNTSMGMGFILRYKSRSHNQMVSCIININAFSGCTGYQICLCSVTLSLYKPCVLPSMSEEMIFLPCFLMYFMINIVISKQVHSKIAITYKTDHVFSKHCLVTTLFSYDGAL